MGIRLKCPKRPPTYSGSISRLIRRRRVNLSSRANICPVDAERREKRGKRLAAEWRRRKFDERTMGCHSRIPRRRSQWHEGTTPRSAIFIVPEATRQSEQCVARAYRPLLRRRMNPVLLCRVGERGRGAAGDKNAAFPCDESKTAITCL